MESNVHYSPFFRSNALHLHYHYTLLLPLAWCSITFPNIYKRCIGYNKINIKYANKFCKLLHVLAIL